VLHFVIVRFI